MVMTVINDDDDDDDDDNDDDDNGDCDNDAVPIATMTMTMAMITRGIISLPLLSSICMYALSARDSVALKRSYDLPGKIAKIVLTARLCGRSCDSGNRCGELCGRMCGGRMSGCRSVGDRHGPYMILRPARRSGCRSWNRYRCRDRDRASGRVS